ncbi:elongation factor Ts, mitochondrial-like [Physella acuta]|uniref:elongation factor Ts, mitochondrial-like n=1 Tax=Physella acuta TaxID=109671 RepID=UPI0027DB33F1|nr:elongation factor Ts, mitochondrial-like [Physella acuta]
MGILNEMRGLIVVKPRLWYVFRSFSQAAAPAADKTLLSKLRKQTGVPFINCKKALVKFDNNYDQAKQWLLDEAKKEGWARATKLQSRPMSQGLVAILGDSKQATMIEVNCETDFVARNLTFKNMVTKLAEECNSYFDKLPDNEVTLGKLELDQIKTSEQSTLADLVVLNVSSLGENMAIRRGIFVRANPGSTLISYVHPSASPIQDRVISGKYGAIVELKQKNQTDKPLTSLKNLGTHLCQHVIGMNPKTIGEYVPRESKQKEPEVVQQAEEPEKDEAATEDEESEVTKETPTVEEDRLLAQDYLLDTSMTVGELVAINNVEVLQFRRFACGEEIEGENS